MACDSKLGELNLTDDEVKRFTEAMKDETFRKMLVDYAEELADPENRKKYEMEITQMESERGMDITFIDPEPGYVIKTSLNGKEKVFINICKSNKIDKPYAKQQVTSSGRHGVHWSIPHSFSPCRNDCDRKGEKCRVYDVVFHPDTYRLAETNKRFKKLVNDTAIEGIERQFDVDLDHNNIKFPKLSFKGKPSPTVIRSRKQDGVDCEMSDIFTGIPYPYDNKTTEEKNIEKDREIENRNKRNKTGTETPYNDTFTKPNYSLIHRSEIDLQDFTEANSDVRSTKPKTLVLEVDLPLINSAASLDLNVSENHVSLESVNPARYKLDLDLPYTVEEGAARFDKRKRKLTVTLPVLHNRNINSPSTTGSNQNIDSIASHSEDKNDNTVNKLNPSNDIKPVLEIDGDDKSNEINVNMLETQVNDESIGECLCESSVVEDNSVHCDINDHDNNVEDIPENSQSSKTPYHFPVYRHRQDSETVSILFDVKNVENDSISKTYPKTNCILVRFTSIGTGQFPMHYSVAVQFEPDCQVDLDKTNIDVSPQNVVMVIYKSHKSCYMWDHFMVGRDESNVDAVRFLTDKNVLDDLLRLEEEAVENQKRITEQSSSADDVTMTELTDNHMVFSIKTDKSKSKGRKKKNKRSRKNSQTENNKNDKKGNNKETSVDNIEVICCNSPSTLHGILKPRSRSESSDDVGPCYTNDSSPTSRTSESATSEVDEFATSATYNIKKSVSFNSHVDKTTFRSNSSVNKMKEFLKHKRRNAKKREEKLMRKRNRQNSGDSYYSSSGDELYNNHCNNDQPMDDGMCSMDHEMSQPSKTENIDSIKHVSDEALAKCVSTSDAYKKQVSDELQESNSDNIEQSVNYIEEVKGMTSNLDSPEVSNEQAYENEVSVDNIRNKSEPGVDPLTVGSAKLDSDDELDNKPSVPHSCQTSSLNWNDQPNMHGDQSCVTKCAFEFDNLLIYDLDID